MKDFDVLPIGTMPPNPTELLFTDRLEKMIRQMRGEYDYVFIDCPPVEIVADTQIIEKLADRTIFVVRSGLMQRSLLGDIEQFYKDKKFKNMSLILNGPRLRAAATATTIAMATTMAMATATTTAPTRMGMQK